MQYHSLPMQTLRRLPVYLKYLQSLAGVQNISSVGIADALGFNTVQVRKDLALVSSGGRPRTGYVVRDLTADIESYLGYDDITSAVLVGAGELGRALLSYKGFAQYGLDIVAAFDIHPPKAGVHGKQVLPAEKLAGLCRRMNIKIGIITVPAAAAQGVCDSLVAGGILAIWNFAPVRLSAPPHILIQSENMAASLALLSKHLDERIARPHTSPEELPR